MERLRISSALIERARGDSGNTSGMDNLAYVQIDDNGKVIAVFNDNTSMDVSELFSGSMINDYKNHNILIRC